MEKVGIITLHRVRNYGSVLQAYALQEVIKKMGYNVELIDYYPKRLTIYQMLLGIKNKFPKFENSFLLRTMARIIIFPSYIKRYFSFRKFVSRYLYTSSKTYKTDNDFKLVDKYDIYCTGSDQVWNSEWNGKFDTPFYLAFAPNDKNKIAYSASFGRINLNKEEIKQIKPYLKRYSNISLREKSGLRILKEIGLKGTQVLDPTLLFDKNDWLKIASKKFQTKKYILVYNLNRNQKIDKYAYNLSMKTGLPIKYITYQLHDFYKKGKMYCSPKVEDFLSLFANASYIVTDSFHATAFSLNFNINFIIVYPEKFSTRLQSILQLCNLENRVAKDENDLSIIDKNINFKECNKLLEQERNKSLKWLENALKN